MDVLKKMGVVLTLSGTVLLGGCASGQHITTSDGTCLTCMNNPFTGKAVNYDPNQQTPVHTECAQSYRFGCDILKGDCNDSTAIGATSRLSRSELNPA